MSVDSAPSPVIVADPPAATAAPTLSGTARDTQTLSSTQGTWSGTPTLTFSRQWLRCDAAGSSCSAIAGATGASYALVAADVGATLRLRVTASNAGGVTQADSAPSGIVAADPPVNTIRRCCRASPATTRSSA